MNNKKYQPIRAARFGRVRGLPRIAGWVAAMSLVVVVGVSGGVQASATTSPPAVDFACSPSCTAQVGAEITFTATTDAANPVFSWDLNGDGIYGDAKGQVATFAYQKPGPYPVSVQVTDMATNLSNIATHKVTITPASPPTVNFACSPSCSAPVGAEITFKAKTDAAKPVFSWDLNGDGTYGDATGQVATFRYQKAGVYPVSVQVTDLSTKLSNTATNPVTITPVSLQAKVSVATKGVLRAGELITFQSQSSLPTGFHPFAYRWDFNNDGRWDADTGFSAVAVHRFSAIGDHTVRMQIQGIEDGVRRISVGSIVFHTAGAGPGCLHVLVRGWLEFLASCIRSDNGKFSMSLDGGVSFAGLELTSSQAGAKLILDTTGSNSGGDNPDHKWAIRSDGPVTVSLMNTAIGTVTLGVLDLQHHPVLLPVGADAPDQNAPGLRVLSLEAQRDCTASPSSTPPVVCARLPGNFAIEGSISVYVTGAGGEDLGAALQANLNLHQPIDVSGHLTLTGDATGLHVDSFSVQTSAISIGQIATINPLTLSYQRHDDDTGQNNVWTAAGGAVLRVIPANPVGVNVALRWADGGSWEVHFDVTGRIPLGPVVLTQLGGTLGFNPFLIGGNVAGSVGPLGLSAGLLYEDAHNGQPWHFQLGSEDPEHDPNHVAPLFVSYPSSNLDVAVLKVGGALNLYGDGFVSGDLNVTFRLPHISSTNPNVNVQGFVRGWFSPPTSALPHSQFQISGGVHVNVRVLISLEGEVQGFVNDYWDHGVEHSTAGGCGHVSADLGIFGHPTIGGWVRVDLLHGDHVDDGVDFSGTGCGNISAYCAPALTTAGHTVPPCLGFAPSSAGEAATHMSAARQSFWIPAGVSTENLKINSAKGIPRVTISGPSGTYTTPPTAQATGHMPYISGADPAEHELIIAIKKPKRGVYKITPVHGSPPISAVLESHPLADPRLRVHLTGTGRARVLRYSLHAMPGQRVEFIERAADASKVIAITTKARGTIRFVPQIASTRARTIIAQFFEHGIPQKPRTVARFTAAAPPTPGKPGKLLLRRVHDTVVITWGPSQHAAAYQVTVIGSDGRHDLYVLRANRHRLVIKLVFPEVSLKVIVRALGGIQPQPGPARAAKLKPRQRRATG